MNPISRRTVLRGLGAAVALPLLESALPVRAFAAQAATASSSPLRMAFLFVPNGISMNHWTPAAEGASFELPSVLEPLAELKSHFSILTGLAQHNANALGDGPGDHARSSAAWLTGVHPKKTAGSDINVGISADQLAAQMLGKSTRFASLELGCERGGLAGDCDSGYSCAYSNSISWRDAQTPVSKETNPRAVFERLFGSGDASQDAESRAKRHRQNLSVLDFVLEDAQELESRVGGKDRQKLDQYLTAIREIEQRLLAYERQMMAQGQVPGKPVSSPRDIGEHIRLMGDMMILAFQSDATRICTFMFANEGSNRSYRQIGIGDGHHEISHHGNDPTKLENKRKIDRYHVEQLAYILKKMHSIQEPGGRTLLQNTMLLYGGGISDGNRHNHDDLPILFAGTAGDAFKQGRHVRYSNGTPLNNLYLSILDRMGVHAETLGDATGKLTGIF